MKKIILVCVVSLLSSCTCCSKKTVYEGVETVVYENSTADFLELEWIKEIEIIPLETTPQSLIGQIPQIEAHNGEYYVIDGLNPKVLRFDSSGKFLNTVGQEGAGPGEYIRKTDFVVDSQSGNVYIYSAQNEKVFIYSAEGDYIAAENIGFQGSNLLKDGRSYWLYTGYGNIYFPERVVKIRNGEAIGRFLPSEAKVLSMSELTPVFTKYGYSLYVRESLRNEILRIDDKEVNPAFIIDYGKYNIPSEYYEMEDPMEAANMLFASDFASTRNFFINNSYVVIESLIQTSDGELTAALGIKNRIKREWRWFNYPMENSGSESIFTESFEGLTEDSELLFLVEPWKLDTTEEIDSPAFSNREALEGLDETNNYVLLKCKLK